MLIIPLGKKGSTGIPIITIFISVVCILVFLFAHNGKDQLALAFYPNKLDPLKMFTSAFAHADIFHLVGNLFFFYSFARTIETQISVKGYLLAFVLFVLGDQPRLRVHAPRNRFRRSGSRASSGDTWESSCSATRRTTSRVSSGSSGSRARSRYPSSSSSSRSSRSTCMAYNSDESRPGQLHRAFLGLRRGRGVPRVAVAGVHDREARA